MAYSEEQRPEAQLGNQNRNSLNIQQPGETDVSVQRGPY
ncbi:hypothetical protein ECTW07945_3367 [Escherichia coli TW07945]|nr:hypothetical protein ECTW07945_3367 [Escherichia coli TW07945]